MEALMVALILNATTGEQVRIDEVYPLPSMERCLEGVKSQPVQKPVNGLIRVFKCVDLAEGEVLSTKSGVH